MGGAAVNDGGPLICCCRSHCCCCHCCCCHACCCWYCCCCCHACCCDCGATKAGPVRPAVAAWYLSSRVSGRPVSAAKGSPPGETGDFGVSWGGGGGAAGAAGASSPL